MMWVIRPATRLLSLQFCSAAVDSSLCQAGRWRKGLPRPSWVRVSVRLLDTESVARGYPMSLTCLALPLLRDPCTPSASSPRGWGPRERPHPVSDHLRSSILPDPWRPSLAQSPPAHQSPSVAGEWRLCSGVAPSQPACSFACRVLIGLQQAARSLAPPDTKVGGGAHIGSSRISSGSVPHTFSVGGGVGEYS